MAREEITVLTVRGDTWEWHRFAPGKERVEGVASGRFVVPAPAAEGQEAEREAAMEEAKRAAAKMGKPLVLGLPPSDALLRVVSLPSVDDAEIAGMVELQADKFSPFPVEQMVVSHEVLKKEETASMVLIGCARREAVGALGRTLADLGVTTSRVDAETLGWLRVLQEAGETAGGGRQVMVLLTGGAPEIVVFQNGMPSAFRTLGEPPVGDEQALEEEIVADLSYTLMALDLEPGSAGGDVGVAIWCRESDMPRVRALAGRIRQECGVDGLAKALDALPTVQEGLARRNADPSAALDLTPSEWREAGRARASRRRMITLAACLFGVWAFFVVGFFGGFRLEQIRTSRMESVQNQWREQARVVRETRSHVGTIRRYMSRDDSALECLREVCVLLPTGIDLTSFAYKKGEGVKISGEAVSPSVVYTFKSGLDGSKLFPKAELRGMNLDRRTGKQSFDMEIRTRGETP